MEWGEKKEGRGGGSRSGGGDGLSTIGGTGYCGRFGEVSQGQLAKQSWSTSESTWLETVV